MRKDRKFLKRIAATSVGILLLCGSIPAHAQEMSIPVRDVSEYSSYTDYSSQAQELTAGAAVALTADNLLQTQGNVEIRSGYADAVSNSIYTAEGSIITWRPGVPAGWYTARITYYPEDCRTSYAVRSVLIDGKIPYDEAKEINLYCTYIDQNGIEQDYYGNDIRSVQKIAPKWQTADLYDGQQYESSPLRFYVAEDSTFGLDAVTDPLTVAKVELIPYSKAADYEQVSKEYKEQGYPAVGDVCEVYEAENYDYKSDPTVIPAADNNSSATPHDNFLVRLNTISGDNWKTAGQYVVWKVTVPQAGLYHITLKTKQNYRQGLYSSRRLYINGEIPFAEANCIRFIGMDSWENVTLGDEENGDWFFYLNAGSNEIKLEAVLGDMGTVLRESSSVIENLNSIYREILSITGASPDTYRDYGLDKLIPDTLENISVQRKRLTEIRNSITAVTGQKGGDLSIFDTLIKQLEKFEDDADNIPPGFTYFKTNIGSLGTWYTSALAQPLALDSITVSSDGVKIPNAKAGFFKALTDSVVSFLASFTVDYNNIGNLTGEADSPITVWMTSGRDQMQILKTMVQNSFVQQTGINVQLENVEGGSILKAVFAGNGPDILLGATTSDPVNYALRNTVYDLRNFADIDEVCKRFYNETLVPFSFNGSLYALPETLSFSLLFYRADILNEMAISLPETWDDVVEITSILQKDNMTFGLPASNLISTYSTFMYQYGGNLYADHGKSCLLSSIKNTDAFEMMTNFYLNYSLELQYDFVNRFRTGEVPVAVETIAAYNNLKASAPETDGLWGIALLPGTAQQDGTINRSGYLSATASMMFKNTKQPEKAYEFLKWWTSADIQTEFGQGIESILGPSSRYLTANREAFERLPWTEGELSVLQKQLSVSRAVEEVPGSYYISRHLNNAFRAVVIRNEDIRDTLDKYTADINKELAGKRREFGL